MKYRNGKCYDDKGNEMTQSQINALYKASQAYIQSIKDNKNQKELTNKEIINKLANNPNFKFC